MMNHLKKRSKTLVLFLVVCLAAVLLTSCGGKMTGETVKAELERLLPESYELNEIFWGKGLEYVDTGTNDRYKPVKEDLGYSSTEDILKKASEVFSEAYVKVIRDAVFTDTEDTDPRYSDINGVLKVDTKNEGFDVKGNVIIDSAVIKKQNRNAVVVTVEHEDGGKTDIKLVFENGKWYLNSPTY